jgi:hypothetical protein
MGFAIVVDSGLKIPAVNAYYANEGVVLALRWLGSNFRNTPEPDIHSRLSQVPES